jgi:hypothetical protein
MSVRVFRCFCSRSLLPCDFTFFELSGFAFSAFGFAASGISADRSWAAEDGRRIRCNKNSGAAPVNFDAHRTGKRGCRSISGSWAHGICCTLTRLMLVAAHEVGPPQGLRRKRHRLLPEINRRTTAQRVCRCAQSRAIIVIHERSCVIDD